MGKTGNMYKSLNMPLASRQSLLWCIHLAKPRLCCGCPRMEQRTQHCVESLLLKVWSLQQLACFSIHSTQWHVVIYRIMFVNAVDKHVRECSILAAGSNSLSSTGLSVYIS